MDIILLHQIFNKLQTGLSFGHELGNYNGLAYFLGNLAKSCLHELGGVGVMGDQLFAVPSCKHISGAHCGAVNSALIFHLGPVYAADELPLGLFLSIIQKIPLGQEAALPVDVLNKALPYSIIPWPFISYLMVRRDLQLGHFIRGLVHAPLIFLLIERLLLGEVLEGLCLEIPAEELVGVLDVLGEAPALLCKELGLFIITTGDNSQGIIEQF